VVDYILYAFACGDFWRVEVEMCDGVIRIRPRKEGVIPHFGTSSQLHIWHQLVLNFYNGMRVTNHILGPLSIVRSLTVNACLLAGKGQLRHYTTSLRLYLAQQHASHKSCCSCKAGSAPRPRIRNEPWVLRWKTVAAPDLMVSEIILHADVVVSSGR
jgi:hypothetical protein